MGVAQTALVAVSSFLAAISSLFTVAVPSQENDLAYVESVLFITPLRDFDQSRYKWRRQQPWLDWTTDSC